MLATQAMTHKAHLTFTQQEHRSNLVFTVQMDSAMRRVTNLTSHLKRQILLQDVSGGFTRELQHLLEHDNWEMRSKLKEAMKDPCFVP